MSQMAMHPVDIHRDGMSNVILELAKQYPAKDVPRELVTNSLDALGSNYGGSRIHVVANTQSNSLGVFDNGSGMSPGQLEYLSKEGIGHSIKSDQRDKRGEKGLGIIAFASAGQRVRIATRENSDQDYGYLVFENKGGKRIMVGSETLSPLRVAREFYGEFDHGTKAIVDGVQAEIMKKVYTPANLRALMGMMYHPALRKGVNISVGRVTQGGKISVKPVGPLEFEGDLLEEIAETFHTDKDGDLELEGQLFYNPEGTGDKVAVYSKDVLVRATMTDIPQFSRSKLWGSGKVTGWINDRFNKLTLGREGFQSDTREYKVWAGGIEALETKWGANIADRIKRAPKEKQNKSISKAWGAVATSINLANHFSTGKQFLKAEVTGDVRTVSGASIIRKTGAESEPAGLGEKGTGVTGRTGGTFEDDPDGTRRKVKPKENAPLGIPVAEDFGPKERDVRSKLADLMGKPLIRLNSGHSDFKARVDKGDEKQGLRYVVQLCAAESAALEASRALESKVIQPDEVPGIVARRTTDMTFNALNILEIK